MLTTRKCIAGAVSSIMCLSLLAASTAAVDVPKTTDIKVDGVLDEAYWDAAEWYPVDIVEGGDATNESVFAAAWDDDNIYIALKAVDDAVVKDNLSSNIYCNDGIELFFDNSAPKPAAYTDETVHVFFQVADEAIDMQGTSSTWANITADHPDIVIHHAMTDDGYTVEAMVPFKDIFIDDPTVGTNINFNITNNDDDDPESWADADRVAMVWFEGFVYNQPDTWGDLTLAKEFKFPEPEPEPEAPSASADTFDLTAVALAASALSAAAFAVSKKKSR